MRYRIVILENGSYRPVTGWQDTPKGLQITVNALVADCAQWGARYFVEEGARRISAPIAKERAA